MDSLTFGWSWPTRWVLLLGLALSTSAVFAQEDTAPAANKLKYRSVLSEYQSFQEQPVSSWQETNATVARIGGWRIYAKEAQEPEKTDKATSIPAQPANIDAHGAHEGKP